MSPSPADDARPATVTPTSPGTPRPRPRPGWTEIAVGLGVLAVVTVVSVRIITPADVGPVAFGLFLTALSAIAAGGGFAVAAVVRIRSWTAFGVRRTSRGWMLVGLAGGVGAFALKFPAIAAYVAFTGVGGNAQDLWQSAATTGVTTVLLSILFLGVLTPIGEELLFRGVLTTALLRYGAVVGVVASALIFAVIHLAPATVLVAVIVGLVAGELRRRSGSVWPGVAVHVTLNVLSNVLAFVVVPALGG
ncbi:CPBP family intramembrane glutamic endopeptidase [Pseudonocardia sp. KRD291]|uniref:CPBP family intramembrane glutamic endopeptidase n=1 Tax=Pseudonocardia sp. KRD291 TaxID=2792007 RepID=UPI001C4A654F|nr:CPBP family intramembrane glutamic endopeptidase [Pseudonocardia sp. KRD291]MBW0102702.1 CPBP family intramembrane metalloprotease [Pseudonocardia sp. KRD291]